MAQNHLSQARAQVQVWQYELGLLLEIKLGFMMDYHYKVSS